jgi:hypothetical protein
MNKKMFLSATTLLALAVCLGFCRSSKTSQTKRINITEDQAGKRVDISIDGKPFTSYIYPDVLKKPVLYPLRTASGNFVTRGWPMDPRAGERVDHPHHVGMWFNYGDVNGFDFWNNSNDVGNNPGPFGTIRHRAVTKMESGNDKAELEVTADWQKPDGTVMLTEKTRFIFTGTTNDRAIERITTLTAAGEDVLFKDNKEGVIGIRLARELEHPSTRPEIFTDASGKATEVAQMNNAGVTGKYRSSEGKEGDDVWGTRGRWVNLTGTVANEPVSMVLLDHPSNVGYPTYWHARGYGLFAANPLGQNAMSGGKETLNYKLAAGKSVTFRHKLLIHSGSQLTDQQVNTAFGEFSRQ